VSRIVDRGAVVAAFVGIGVAVTIGVSLLLVIPIEPLYWLLTVPAGLLIGYYANQRSAAVSAAWHRVLANALFAGAVTGLAMAVLLLGVKALFFSADNGYRDEALGGPIACQTGADCVYRRYLDANRGGELAAAGVTDVASFASFYWQQQLTTAGLLLGVTTSAAVVGGALYLAFRPKRSASAAERGAQPAT
jgi:hypothetical protein